MSFNLMKDILRILHDGCLSLIYDSFIIKYQIKTLGDCNGTVCDLSA